MGSDFSIGPGDSQLREDLADAMRESPGRQSRDSSGELLFFFYFNNFLHILIFVLLCPL